MENEKTSKELSQTGPQQESSVPTGVEHLQGEELIGTGDDLDRPATPPALLIVDDEENVLNSLKRTLRGESYNIFTAQSIINAIKIIKNNNISLILSDYLMPEMSGIEFCREALAISPDTLCILLTGKADNKETIEALKQNVAYRFLTKPWDNEELKFTLRQVMEHKLAMDELKMARKKLQQKDDTLTRSVIQLKKLREFNQDIKDNMHSGLVVTDLDGEILEINKAAMEILHISPETDFKMSNITDINPSLKAFYEIEETSAQRNLEIIYPGKKPITIGFSSSHLKGHDGKTCGYITIFRDLTSIIRAGTALRKSEIRYRLLAENISDVIFTTDMSFNFMYLSPSITRMSGYTAEEALKLSLDRHFTKESFQIFNQTIKEALVKEQFSEFDPQWTQTLELDQYRKDGSTFSQETALRFLRDQNDKPIGVLGVIRDITERKEMEEERLKVSKLQSISILAGGIAHDFNNFLTGIIGYISLVKFQIKPQEPIYQYLNKIETACQHATNLTNQLLTFSKGIAPVKKIASITEIVKDAARFSLSGSNVRCRFSLPEDLWLLEVDAGQIGQVINNLVINAVQAMPKGGMIEIGAENIEVKRNDGLPLKEGKYIKLTIKDEGLGISKENLNKIFDPYFTTKETGNGLGLATSYSIIKNHDGLLDVTSTENEGSAFYIYLPVTDQTIILDEPEEELALKGTGKILLMDDEEIVRNVASEMLCELGYDVETADNGAEAIKIYTEALKSEEPFEAVIMDLTVPGGMGGKDAIKQLIEIDPEIKPIISSGYSRDVIMADYQNYGFKGVVTKPYKIEELGKILKKVLTGETE